MRRGAANQDMVDDETVCDTLEQADQAGAHQLRQYCLHHCLEHFSAVSKTAGFERMRRALLTEIAALAIYHLNLASPFALPTPPEPGRSATPAPTQDQVEIVDGAGIDVEEGGGVAAEDEP